MINKKIQMCFGQVLIHSGGYLLAYEFVLKQFSLCVMLQTRDQVNKNE
jgi:hypothetical protein